MQAVRVGSVVLALLMAGVWFFTLPASANSRDQSLEVVAPCVLRPSTVGSDIEDANCIGGSVQFEAPEGRNQITSSVFLLSTGQRMPCVFADGPNNDYIDGAGGPVLTLYICRADVDSTVEVENIEYVLFYRRGNVVLVFVGGSSFTTVPIEDYRDSKFSVVNGQLMP